MHRALCVADAGDAVVDDLTLRKLGHDLRGILSPAMMVAERLENHPDPAISRAGTLILESLDRAVALLNKVQS
jgi:hypothetical protein